MNKLRTIFISHELKKQKFFFTHDHAQLTISFFENMKKICENGTGYIPKTSVNPNPRFGLLFLNMHAFH